MEKVSLEPFIYIVLLTVYIVTALYKQEKSSYILFKKYFKYLENVTGIFFFFYHFSKYILLKGKLRLHVYCIVIAETQCRL